MSPTTRGAVLAAAAISLAIHIGLLVGISGVALLRAIPSIPIEILPMQKRPTAPPVLSPTKEPSKPKSTTTPSAPKPKPAGKPVAKPVQVAPLAPDVHELGPSNANVTLVLRGPLLARSPHRDGVDQLLSMLPDYHTLLDGTGLHPFDDLEALLIATPDPRDVSATFLAARHRRDPRIAQLTDRKLGAADPRVFRALSDDIMLLGRPEDLAHIEATDGQEWLTALRQFDGGPKEAALLLTISNLQTLIRIQSELPLPHSIRVALSADGSPFVRLVCVFEDETNTERFALLWPTLKLKLAESVPIFAGGLDDLVLIKREREVEVAGRLKETHVSMLLSFAKMFGGHPPAPAEPMPDLK